MNRFAYKVSLTIAVITLLQNFASTVVSPAGKPGDKDSTFEAKVCNPLQYHKPHLTNQSKYYECRPFTTEEQEGWGAENLGIWTERTCPDPTSEEFDELFQKCENKRKRRRQFLSCNNNLNAAGCSTVCTAPNVNPTVGGACSWASASLSPDATMNKNFLQCAPMIPGDACGQWTQMSCGPASRFNPQLQICIQLSLPNSCLPTQVPICNCGVGGTQGQVPVCPDGCACHGSVCCHTIQVTISLSVLPTPVNKPVCADGGLPVCSCDVGCPRTTACQTNIGCCPSPMLLQTPPIDLCSAGGVSVGQCSSGCPIGAACELGHCCFIAPANINIPGTAPAPAHLSCLDGAAPVGRCIDKCPPGSHCQMGLCCPDNLPPLQLILSTPPQLVGSLTPVPSSLLCPGGLLPLGQCNAGCPALSLCIPNIGCCPPSISQVGQVMSSNQQQLCPGGLVPSCPCNLGCPVGTICLLIGCCPTLPVIPQQPAVLPVCPGGQLPTSSCIPGQGCPTGFNCQNQGCCPNPSSINICSTGQMATGMCQDGSANCPLSTICQNGLCCPPALPICPDGTPSVQTCVHGLQCPPGTSCIGGGCCIVLVPQNTMICPPNQMALCQCQPGSVCPPGTSCINGVCCASAQLPFWGGQLPGGVCAQNNQCNGIAAGSALCTQNICTCSDSSRSNGISCLPNSVIGGDVGIGGNLIPSIHLSLCLCCQQFQAPSCRFAYNKAKRRPQLEPVVNDSTPVVSYQPLENTIRHCLNNNTCTVNELCLDGICIQKKSPGEYGCKIDSECNSRCPTSFCDKEATMSTGVCKCSNGFVFADLCYRKCPMGTFVDGYRCQVTKENTNFWEEESTWFEIANGHSCHRFKLARS